MDEDREGILESTKHSTTAGNFKKLLIDTEHKFLCFRVASKRKKKEREDQTEGKDNGKETISRPLIAEIMPSSCYHNGWPLNSERAKD